MYLVEMFVVSLILTLVIELMVGVLLGVKCKPGILLLIVVNVLTNPIAVLAAWIVGLYFPNANNLILQLVIEIIVIISEGFIYWDFSKNEVYGIKHPVKLSVLSNAISWGTVFVLDWLI